MDSELLVKYRDWIRENEARRSLLGEREATEIGCHLAKAFVVECFDGPPSSDLVVFVPTQGIDNQKIVLDHGFGRFTSCPRTGNFVINTPGVPSEASGVGPFEMLTVSLPWTTIRRSTEWLTGEQLDHLPVQLHNNGWHDDYTVQLFLKLWDSIQIQSPNDRLVLDELVLQITERLLWLGGTRLPQTKFDAVLDRQKLSDVIDYIGGSLASPVSLLGLSQVAGCSQYHFSRLFRRSTGYSPMEYLIRCRINRAQEILKRKDGRSLASVAVDCGFSDQSHMGRHFKRFVGMSPKQWREEL